MLTPDQIRYLPRGKFAFETSSGREITCAYDPNETHPETLFISTIAKLQGGSPYAIVRTYPVTAKLTMDELAAKGEELNAEAGLKESKAS